MQTGPRSRTRIPAGFPPHDHFQPGTEDSAIPLTTSGHWSVSVDASSNLSQISIYIAARIDSGSENRYTIISGAYGIGDYDMENSNYNWSQVQEYRQEVKHICSVLGWSLVALVLLTQIAGILFGLIGYLLSD